MSRFVGLFYGKGALVVVGMCSLGIYNLVIDD